MTKVLYVSATLVSVAILWLIIGASKQGGNVLFIWAESIAYGDKIGHVAMSAALTVMLAIITRLKSLNIAGIAVYWSLVASVALLSAAEATHLINPHRSFEWADLIANYLGALLGVSITGLIHDYLQRYL